MASVTGLLCALVIAIGSIPKMALAEKDTTDRSSMYFPNTEVLGPGEMRVTALGTGLPTPLTRAQKSTAWMVELGNGDVFLFDIGTGSMENLFGLRPDFSKIDKVFLSHLHSDHFGDLDAFIVGSWLSGRYTPLHVYGGSGETPELGVKAAVGAVMKALAWDIKSRTGILPDVGGQVIAHEFDYKQEDQVVFTGNGVKITSWPAIHGLDGAVSYRLEWNGLSFVFGGDTRPNKWFIKYARDADFAIHECFPTPAGLAAFNDWEMRPSTYVTSYIHTPPEGFGKVMSEIKPRMAVAYHTVLLSDIRQGMLEGIRETYDGPLTIATDLMVWNVTKDTISLREAVFADRVTPPPTTEAYKKAPRSGEATMSKFIMDGVWKGFTPPPLPKE
jgi:ribonuclease Z